MYDIGLRVIRGPDWHWDNQDGGEGCVGTVSEFGTRMSPDKTVVVLWDIGYRTNYRIGYDGSYDLRIFDNASIGVNQTRIMCNGCKIRDFSGMRFKCARCYDYDLCFECYMKDHHDLSHSFRRYETSSSHDFVEIPPRENSVKWQIKGIFPGAQVIRGLDWDWNDQDGGSGHVGNVTDIRGWDTETNRSVASITWLKTGVKNVYRVGHKGKVDIRCVKPAVWGYCYVDHLPILGQPSHCLPRAAAAAAAAAAAVENVVSFSSGEKVKVNVSEDRLKVLQEGHGGWNPRMIQYIGEVGVVHRVTDKGDVRVQFEHCNNRWTFHPAALIKINRFKVGDLVRMIDDVSKVKELQKGHGEWLDIMATDIGKTGKVAKIYSDGDLRVNINDQSWTLNPSCIEPIAEFAPMSNANANANANGNDTDTDTDVDTTEELRRAVDGITQIIENLERSGETSLENILQQVEAGNSEFLDKFFPKSRARENLVRNGKTCLHIACHEGQTKLVRFLLSLGANAQTQDNEGDTALHYATYGNQAAVLEILLNHDATNVDKVNKNLCSALHIAVNKQFYQCAKVLLRFHCDANLQDSFGDTALHDAVGKGDVDLVDLLCNESNANINYALVNKQGFNVIHMCALKGHVSIMEKLFQKARHLVDRKKDDGFAAIHLSSLNGYVAVTRMLIVKGRTDINLRNSRDQTPLHLAVSQKRYSVVELLVELGADVNAQDANGDTILHLILDNKKAHTFSADFNAEEAPNIYQVFNKFNATDPHSEIYMLASIICYLIQCGCSVVTKNINNVSPLQLIRKNQSLFDVLKTIPESIFRLELNADSTASVSSTSLPRESNAENTTTNASCKTVNAEIGSENVARTLVECLICSELSEHNVILKPCEHKIACEECSSRMKKCIECRKVITKRITRDGRVVPGKTRQKSAERVKYLEGKIAEIEEVHCCPICMERSRNVVFLCGHGACDRCCLTLTMCHMCRTLITKKISLY